jgi:hypothetical protein
MDLSLVQSNTFNMRWWVLILLPFHLLAQETYNDCEILQPQSYQVDYEADKIYYWSITRGDIISALDNTIIVQWPDSAGDYLITVFTTRFGCDGDTSDYQVVINPCPYATLFFPSSFTPNKDGINETYFVGGKSADNIEYITIYNRWGNRIFEADGNIPWTGDECAAGVYVVSVFVNNNRFTRKVTLIR